MPDIQYLPIYGTVQSISERSGQCCEQIITVMTQNGIANLVISAQTYVIDQVKLRRGMSIAAFYDANAPMILIYPPQYRIIAIGQRRRQEQIAMNFFDRNLVAADNSLRLNLARTTEIVSENGQDFNCTVQNRVLIVFYSITTRSIPPQTTPRKLIVFC